MRLRPAADDRHGRRTSAYSNTCILLFLQLLLCLQPLTVLSFYPIASSPLVIRSPSISSTDLGLSARMPEIYDWQITSDGGILGTVRHHPVIENGSMITTSPIVDRNNVKPKGGVCETENGTKYRLLKAQIPVIRDWELTRDGGVVGAVNFHPAFGDGEMIITSPLAYPRKVRSTGGIYLTVTGSKYRLARNPNFTPFGTAPKEEKTIGNGKYLLVDSPFRSTSGKSKIYVTYATDEFGQMTGPRLIAKLSTNYGALSREAANYDKATDGLFNGKFVEKIDFLRDAGGNSPDLSNQSALIIEGGVKDLKALLLERNEGLSGESMRDAARAAGLCIQAMHSSNLVWTDLKTENFVCVEDVTGDPSEGLKVVKGIDLESAIVVGGNPVDYSPEACPPEFARAFVVGAGTEFILKKNYDMWSLGMLLFECSTGREYFEGDSPLTITTLLKVPDFAVDVSDVEDKKLRDLIGSCLQTDPNRRIGITQFLLHPYFRSSGNGLFNF